jgi:hypothetical protein
MFKNHQDRHVQTIGPVFKRLLLHMPIRSGSVKVLVVRPGRRGPVHQSPLQISRVVALHKTGPLVNRLLLHRPIRSGSVKIQVVRPGRRGPVHQSPLQISRVSALHKTGPLVNRLLFKRPVRPSTVKVQEPGLLRTQEQRERGDQSITVSDTEYLQ